MKLRAFAAAWTAFTMLAAPALLLAQDEVPPEQPAAGRARGGRAPARPETPPAPEEAVPPRPAEPALEPPAAEQPAGRRVGARARRRGPEPERRRRRRRSPRTKRRPVARAAASATVNISDFDFAPTSVTVNVGDTVTWVNAGPTVHTATGSGFDTGNLEQGRERLAHLRLRRHVRLHLHAAPVHEGQRDAWWPRAPAARARRGRTRPRPTATTARRWPTPGPTPGCWP